MAFKDFQLKWFWSKLMVWSEAVNSLPDAYLTSCKNARVIDGWISVRKWKTLLKTSTIWTNNKGAFTMWWKLYQITNSKIYEVDTTTGTQTDRGTLWFDLRCDILVYDYIKEVFTSLWTHSFTYNYSPDKLTKLTYSALNTLTFSKNTVPYDSTQTITTSNTWYYRPSIKILSTSTQTFDWWSGEVVTWWRVLELWETAYSSTLNWTTNWTVNIEVWYYTTQNLSYAVIWMYWKYIYVFDWTTVTEIKAVPENSWILEYTRWFSFLTWWNTLYISSPITRTNPEYWYDFTGSWSQNIVFNKEILWLKGTMTGLYIFTDNQIQYLWANSLQNVSWSATFISQPLWDSSWPINNTCITASWDKIFYLSKNMQIQTVNYIWWTDWTSIWELSAKPVVWIKKLLDTFDPSQPTAFAFYNENDKTIQFHLRNLWSTVNDKVLIYDLINDTWWIDTNKGYNYVVRLENQYYWFLDANSSIYKDDIWTNDNWSAIDFEIKTNHNISTNQSMFGWFYLKWWIAQDTNLTIKASIGWDEVFNNTILWASYPLSTWLNAFDKRATQSQIYRLWQRIEYTITSTSTNAKFILDSLWTTAEPTNFVDSNNIW